MGHFFKLPLRLSLVLLYNLNFFKFILLQYSYWYSHPWRKSHLFNFFIFLKYFKTIGFFIQFFLLNMLIKIIQFALILALIRANAEADWVDPNDLPIPFLIKPFFSGYISDSSTSKAFFYAYHPSENNPTKDPVIVWFGSGPGCSALYSMMYSKGPFVFVPNTSEFRINPYNWNKQSNLVFIQSPAGTGFSIGNNISSDYTLADDHIQALLYFFMKFPGLKDQQLYLAGEGYAGVTVPWAAQRILRYNSEPFVVPSTRINLKGILIGNPCTHPNQCYLPGNSIHSYQYLKNHYFYTSQQWQQYKSGCMGIFRPQCDQIKKRLDGLFTATGTDRRNIYKRCLQQNTSDPDVIPCLDSTGILQFFNNKDVKEAIHAVLNPGHRWSICSSDVMQAFTKDPRGSYFIYSQLIQANLRIWIYSGSLDASNPITGTMKWIEQLRMDNNLATIQPWSNWQYKDVEAGEIWKIRGLTFLTIRSAGHLVFQDQPEIGYYILDGFLKNKNL